MRPKFFRAGGFTLIELLVVVAIIGILASVVLASLNSARAKARDALRAGSVHSVQTALELYYNDHGYYPQDSYASPPGNSDVPFEDPTLVSNLTPTYIGSMPLNPSGTCGPGYDPCNYHYFIGAANPAQWYAILILYETKAPCYVGGGTGYSTANGAYWGANMCK